MTKAKVSSVFCYELKKLLTNLLKIFLLTLGLMGLIQNIVLADNHGDLTTTPCDIRLVFSTDNIGMPSVSYKLGLQIRNRVARNIVGVSIYWLDKDAKIIGNSGATCGADEGGIGPSEAGHCETIVQQIGGPLLKKLGEDTWTKIINHELENFKKVKYCSIIGYDYLNSH